MAFSRWWTEVLGQYQVFAELVKAHSQLHLELVPTSFQFFTSHATDHSERLLDLLESLLTRRVVLEHHEAFILYASAWLHDVALMDPREIAPSHRDTSSEAVVRRYHGEDSAAYVRRILPTILLKNGAMVGDVVPELTEGVAWLCAFHVQPKGAIRPPRTEELKRLPLLGWLFVVADFLEIGPGRAPLERILASDAPLPRKEFYLLQAAVRSVEIHGDVALVKVSRAEGIEPSRFRSVVVRDFLRALRAILSQARRVFERFQVRGLRAVLEIVDAAPTSQFAALELLAGRIDDDAKLVRRRASADKRVERRLSAPGAIRRQTIGNEFHVLRRWGSSTHRLFGGPQGLQRGGGYFLAWQGTGFAIDPGYDYISNLLGMRNIGLSISDIHAVIASHAHDDHTHDLEPIVALQYRLNKLASRDGLQKEFPVFCSEAVRLKYAPLPNANSFLRIVEMVPTQNGQRARDALPNKDHRSPFLTQAGVVIEYMLGFHGEHPWHSNHTGLVMKMRLLSGEQEFCFGYTSDTSLKPEIVDFLRDADVILMHLGNRKARNGSPYPDHHLGEGGCADLVSALKNGRPRLFLIGEFGVEEFMSRTGDDRISFTRRIERVSGADTVGRRVLPADIGLRLSIPDLCIWAEASSALSGRPTGDNLAGRWVPPLAVLPMLGSRRQIHYIA